MITADEVRDLIVRQDADRPRSKQVTLGPSDLGSPCARKLAYKLLGVEPVTATDVNLAAWVGTGIHAQMELALKAENKRAKRRVWEVELPLRIDLGEGRAIPCHVDAYNVDRATAIDWKSVGPSALSKYKANTPDNYATQIDLYGLALVLSGRRVEHVGIGYIPRNGDLKDIHVVTWEWTGERADAAIKRYEALLSATAAGPAVLPLLPTAADCRFCPWWAPGSDDPTTACPGMPSQNPRGQLPPWNPEETAQEKAST